MFLLGLQLFCLSLVLAILYVQYATALQQGASFQGDVEYDGIVPNDESFYTQSFERVSKIRCCTDCKLHRPSCAGVLYNREERECKLLKRYMTAADKLSNISHEGWEYMKITEDSDCKRTVNGWEYRGKIHVTKSGRTCQVWSSQSPHSHGIGTDLPENYCRNPDSEPTPWCFTTDPDVRYEMCDIPMCVTPPLECITDQDPTGISYFGTQNVADTGDLCQRWDSQTPHAHTKDVLADQGNYCRNPDGEEDAPWCYTVNPDKRWSECIIPRC